MFVHKITMFIGKIHFRYLMAMKVSHNLPIYWNFHAKTKHSHKVAKKKTKNFGNKMTIFRLSWRHRIHSLIRKIKWNCQDNWSMNCLETEYGKIPIFTQQFPSYLFCCYILIKYLRGQSSPNNPIVWVSCWKFFSNTISICLSDTMVSFRGKYNFCSPMFRVQFEFGKLFPSLIHFIFLNFRYIENLEHAWWRLFNQCETFEWFTNLVHFLFNGITPRYIIKPSPLTGWSHL